MQIAETGTLAWVMFGLSSVIGALAVALSLLMLRTQVKTVNKFLKELQQVQICTEKSLESCLLPLDLLDEVFDRFQLETEPSGRDNFDNHTKVPYMDNLKQLESALTKFITNLDHPKLLVCEQLPSYIERELQMEREQGGKNRVDDRSMPRSGVPAWVDPLDPDYRTLTVREFLSF